MDIPADSILLPPDNQCDLAVRLQSDQSVYNMAARLLEHFRPLNVVFLVKARLQLDQRCHLLAVLGSPCQCRYNRRMTAHAVKRDLDGQNIRIISRTADEVHDRIKGFVRMRQENILFPDCIKQIHPIRQVHKRRNRLRDVRLFLQVFKALHPVQLHQEGQIQRSADLVDGIRSDSEFLLQNLEQLFVHPVLILKPDDLAPLTLPELFLDFVEQIIRIVLVQCHICISRDPVRVRTDNVIAGKQLSHVPLDDLLEQDSGSCSFLRTGDLDHPRKHGRNLDGCEHCPVLEIDLLPILAVLAVVLGRLPRDPLPCSGQILLYHRLDGALRRRLGLAGNQGADVQGLVAHKRKWS